MSRGIKLPGIDYWFERIDATMVAVFAQRRFDEAPRYTVFAILQCPDHSWPLGYAARDELRQKLEAFEGGLIRKYGARFLRQWQADARFYGIEFN